MHALYRNLPCAVGRGSPRAVHFRARNVGRGEGRERRKEEANHGTRRQDDVVREEEPRVGGLTYVALSAAVRKAVPQDQDVDMQCGRLMKRTPLAV